MTATRIHPELAPYLDRLVGVLTSETAVEAVYLIGSAASGAYEHGRSDVDVVAVTTSSLALDERRALAAAVEAIPVPARKLELVVYPRGSDRWEINLNTGEHVSFDPVEEAPFWFVLDRAIAQEHAVPLVGPAWNELFAPVADEQVFVALSEALDWQEREEPVGRSALLNTVRAWRWLETRTWVSKPEAAAWLRERVRERIGASR